jgi:hypothetical protein
MILAESIKTFPQVHLVYLKLNYRATVTPKSRFRREKGPEYDLWRARKDSNSYLYLK